MEKDKLESKFRKRTKIHNYFLTFRLKLSLNCCTTWKFFLFFTCANNLLDYVLQAISNNPWIFTAWFWCLLSLGSWGLYSAVCKCPLLTVLFQLWFTDAVGYGDPLIAVTPFNKWVLQPPFVSVFAVILFKRPRFVVCLLTLGLLLKTFFSFGFWI